MNSPRIKPLDPPFDSDVVEAFNKIMPPGMDPLRIFRVFAHNPLILKRQMHLGSVLLNKGSVPHREREVLLLRTCARCGSEYEWGVHVTGYARPLKFTDEQIRATVLGDAASPVWSAREALLVRLADELHDTSTVTDELWNALEAEWTHPQLLEFIVVAGMYHAVSFVTNAARIELEAFGERFPASA